MIGYFIISGIMTVIGMILSARLKSKFNHYAQIPVRSGLSGAEVAQRMLTESGVHDVVIQESQGFLSDHYNPANKTVNLSPDVFHGRSVSAAAVAAHECGHAVQHATAYPWLKARSAIVPAVQFASMAQQWLLMFALGAYGMGQNSTILLITIVAFLVTALFSLITLPVEFDASRRALVWLSNSNLSQGEEFDGAKDALWWAAMTYVASALNALVILLFLIMRYMGSSRE